MKISIFPQTFIVLSTMHFKKQYLQIFILLVYSSCYTTLHAQNTPGILTNKEVINKNYLPDFSYAGYHFGEKPIPQNQGTVVHATDYGVVADDQIDDSKALLKALENTKSIEGKVILQLPPGKVILSEILYIQRSNFVLRGAGVGKEGTEIYCPRPLRYMDDPQVLQELREYLKEFKKQQRVKDKNIDLPFSQYAWSGGIIWTEVPGERVKAYLDKYDQPKVKRAQVSSGKMGEHTFKVSSTKDLKVGDVLQLELFNKEGENGKIIQDLYQGQDVKVGSHHWKFPKMALVRQQVKISSISGNTVTIKSPLTISIEPEYQAQLVEWKHLEEVGIEHLRLSFPVAPKIAHHVEEGYNGIYLTRLYNSWVKDVVITNADSGILTESVANTSIENIVTNGKNKAHYSVAMSGVYNVLVNNLRVENSVIHPLSFNTFSTKSVYQNCEVMVDPVLDQHGGANHQNLFDNITVHVSPEQGKYPLFKGGGAGYWKPSHGAYSTFWNINVHFLNGLGKQEPVLLNGMEDGVYARLIGIRGNRKITIQYDPMAFIELTNKNLTIPSLYDYQLKSRLNE